METSVLQDLAPEPAVFSTREPGERAFGMGANWSCVPRLWCLILHSGFQVPGLEQTALPAPVLDSRYLSILGQRWKCFSA